MTKYFRVALLKINYNHEENFIFTQRDYLPHMYLFIFYSNHLIESESEKIVYFVINVWWIRLLFWMSWEIDQIIILRIVMALQIISYGRWRHTCLNKKAIFNFRKFEKSSLLSYKYDWDVLGCFSYFLNCSGKNNQ